jgi:hypothetical protein
MFLPPLAQPQTSVGGPTSIYAAPHPTPRSESQTRSQSKSGKSARRGKGKGKSHSGAEGDSDHPVDDGHTGTLSVEARLERIAMDCRKAAKHPRVDEALELLKDCEARCLRESDLVDDKSPPTLPNDILVLTALTAQTMRSWYMRVSAWQEALTAGQKAVNLESELVRVADPQRPNTVRDQRSPLGAAMALTSSYLHLATIHSKLGNHEAGLECAKRSLATIKPMIDAEGGVERVAEAVKKAHLPSTLEENPLVLLAAAQYNLSVELEHCGEVESAAQIMRGASRTAMVALPMEHPIRTRIEEAVAAQKVVVPRAPLTARPSPPTAAGSGSGESARVSRRPSLGNRIAVPEPLTGRPVTSEGSSRPTSHPASATATLQGKDGARPQTVGHGPLPPLDLSGVAVLPAFGVDGRSGAMVPIVSRSSPADAWQDGVPQAKVTPLTTTETIDVTALVASSSVPAQAQPPSATNREEGSNQTPSLRGKGFGSSMATSKRSAVQQRYLTWLEDATGALFEDYSRRHRAALRIQCAWRSLIARLRAHNRRQVLYHFIHMEEQAAARCIIGFLQSKIKRRKFRNQAIARQAEERARAAMEYQLKKAINLVTKFLRTCIQKRKRNADIMRRLELEHEAKLRQYETAAIIVQRWWPVIRMEKQYWRGRNAQIAEERAKAQAQERLTNAATNIARVFRGHLGRKYAKNYRKVRQEQQRDLQRRVKESIDVVRIFLKELRLRLNRQRREKELTEHMEAVGSRMDPEEFAAHSIEKLPTQPADDWSTALERRGVHLLADRARLMNSSAVIIQTCFRGHRARRELRYLRTVTRTTNRIRLERELKREQSTLKIQCAFRQHLARKERRRRLASLGWKILSANWTLQRVGRAFLDRTRVGVEAQLRRQLFQAALQNAIRVREERVTTIQCFCREAISSIERHRRILVEAAEDALIYRRMVAERIEDAAALRIQTQIRRHQAALATEERRVRLHEEQLGIVRRVVKIQCAWRQFLSRRLLRYKKVQQMRQRDKKREFEAVQNELFAMRAQELDALEGIERGLLEKAERESLLHSLAQYDLPLPLPKDDESHDGDARSDKSEGEDDNEEEEGIYD